MRTLLISLLLLGTFSSHVQAQALFGLNKDSLRQVAARAPDDTLKIGILLTLGQQYENNQPDSALYFYQQAGKLSLRLKDHVGYIRYVSNYSVVLNMRGRYRESLQLNLETIDTCLTYHLGGISYLRALVNTGNVYEMIGDHDSAAVYYLKALPEVEASGDGYRQTTLYNNLSGLYRNLRQLPKAVDYGQKALQLADKIDDPFAAAGACINLGNALKDLNRLDEGHRYLQKAYDIGHQLHDSATMEMALIDIGDTWLQRRSPDKYIPAYSKALALARALNDVSGEAYSQQGLAFGLFWTSRYKETEALLNKAIPFARDNDQKDVLHGLLLLMSDVQMIQGHMDEYRSYRLQSDSVGNAIVNASVVKNVQELETKYQVEKSQHDLLRKDLELAEKDRQAVRQRTGLTAAVVGVLLLAILFFLTWRISRQKQQLHRRTIQAMETEQENVRLKARLEGQYQERQRISQEMHDDMGSGLTSLLFLGRALTPGNETVSKMTRTAEQLIRKMNEIIWTLNQEQDTLDSLVAYIRTNAAELMEAAGIDFEFEYNGDGANDRPVSQEFRRNVYLVTKEAVHNVIKHSGGTKVTISVAVSDSGLTINIHDNGEGFDPAAVGRWGNGLKNMRRRMEQIGGRLTIEKNMGTRVGLSAPL